MSDAHVPTMQHVCVLTHSHICRYMMPDELDLATNYINYAFTLCFVIEMILKLAGLGVGGYVSEGMNIFDGFVTIAGLVEMIIDLTPAQGSMGSYLSVLRAFRLLRVFRLARSWKSLNRIIKVLLSSIAAVSWLTGLLVRWYTAQTHTHKHTYTHAVRVKRGANQQAEHADGHAAMADVCVCVCPTDPVHVHLRVVG